MAIASNPYVLGIGLSDQAAFIRRADTMIEVVGLASLYLVDGQAMTSTNVQTWKPGPARSRPTGCVRWSCSPTIVSTWRPATVQSPEINLPMPVRSSL